MLALPSESIYQCDLRERGFSVHSSGTTIVAANFGDEVILAADCRATNGTSTADPNAEKLHRVSDRIFAAGAGTAADIRHAADWMANLVRGEELTRGRLVTMSELVSRTSDYLLRHPYLGAYLLVGGYDAVGPRPTWQMQPLHDPSQANNDANNEYNELDRNSSASSRFQIYEVSAHGYALMTVRGAQGSGSFHAKSILDTIPLGPDGYCVASPECPELETTKRLEYIVNAVTAGALYDAYSGEAVNVLRLNGKDTPQICRVLQIGPL